MPTTLLKDILPVVLPTIMKIFNLSLSEGQFHHTWKTAIVHPLLKKLGLDLINPNYRPVSKLSFISKLIEKCMWEQVHSRCKEFNLQPDYQSAYREGYSCETALS